MKDDLVHENLKRVDEPEVIIAALHVLTDRGALSDLTTVMGLARHPVPAVQAAAVTTACALIRNQLYRNFDMLDEVMRAKLVQLLETMHPGVVDEIAKDVFGGTEEERLRGIRILALFKRHPHIREIIAKLLTDKDVKVRATAVNILGNIIGPTDQHLVLSLLTDKDKRVRANTVEALENVGNPRMIPLLQRLRKDQSNRIRGNVLKALYTLGHRGIDEDVLEMLGSGNDLMQASGLWVVTRTLIQSREIEDAAGLCLVSSSPMVVENARKALQTIGTVRARGYLSWLDEGLQAPEKKEVA